METDVIRERRHALLVLAAAFAQQFSANDQAKFFGGNAAKFYCVRAT